MARRRNIGRRRRVRRNRQKRRSTPSQRSVSTVTVTAHCVRSFSFFCPRYSEKFGASVKSWLEELVRYGTIALKIFTFIISVLEPHPEFGADKHVITSAVQSVLIGVEDLLFSSPLSERVGKPSGENKVTEVACLDFKSARMPTATVTITPGSAMKDRSGRYAAVLLPLTEEEYVTYLPKASAPELIKADNFEFKDLIQMPGCRLMPFGRAMTLKWKAHPTSYAYRFLMVGQSWIDGQNPNLNILGGKPSFRLLIGFQDFANTEGDTVTMYSASNAMVHVDIRATVQLTEPVTADSGRRYIRDWPQVTQDAKLVTATNTSGVRRDIPISEFYVSSGSLYHQSALTLDELAIDSPGH